MYLLIKKFIKKIPGVVPIYEFGYITIKNLPQQSKNIQRSVALWFDNELKRKERQIFAREVEKWNFNHSFSELIKFAQQRHDDLEALGNKLIKSDKINPKGYALIHACLAHQPKEGHYDAGLAAGSELVSKGRIKEARAFFLSLQKICPEVYDAHAILYDIIHTRQEAYRAAPEPSAHRAKKPLLISFSVWGDKYIRFFNDYCMAAMMAKGNLPSIAHIRDILVDIYAHPEDIAQIKKLDSFDAFSKLCEVNFIEFPKRLVTSDAYKKYDSNFRYYIYGGFHHVSIERARSLGADIMCLGPDNIYSDGSLFNYVKLVDEGYSSVLFTSTRAQAEFLLPVLDKMKDPSSRALSITSDEMVDFSAQYIHHNFLPYIVTDDQTPPWRSAFFIPHKNGFYIRCFHYHPVIISAAAIDKSKDIRWNYATADITLISALFPNRKEWENIKVITDSREGIMLDVAHANPGSYHVNNVEFSEEYLNRISRHFNENEFWNFKFVVDYRTKNEMSGVRAYLYGEDGNLHPKDFPLTAALEDIRACIDDWYESKTQGKLAA